MLIHFNLLRFDKRDFVFRQKQYVFYLPLNRQEEYVKSTNDVTTTKGEDFFLLKKRCVHPKKKREREEREKT